MCSALLTQRWEIRSTARDKQAICPAPRNTNKKPPQVGWVGGKKEACTQTATFNVQLDEDVWVQQQAFNENAAKRTIKTAMFKAQLGQDERRVPNL